MVVAVAIVAVMSCTQYATIGAEHVWGETIVAYALNKRVPMECSDHAMKE